MGCGCLKKPQQRPQQQQQLPKVTIKPPGSDISSIKDPGATPRLPDPQPIAQHPGPEQSSFHLLSFEQKGDKRQELGDKNNSNTPISNSQFSFMPANTAKPQKSYHDITQIPVQNSSRITDLLSGHRRSSIQDKNKQTSAKNLNNHQSQTDGPKDSSQSKIGSNKKNSLKELIAEQVDLREQDRSSVPILRKHPSFSINNRYAETNPSKFSIQITSQKSLATKSNNSASAMQLKLPESKFRLKPIPYFKYAAEITY